MSSDVHKTKTIFQKIRIKQEIIDSSNYDVGHSSLSMALMIDDLIGENDRETFLVIGLNTKLNINVINECHVGTLNSIHISPKDIFKTLLLSNSASFIIAHNHPSGDTSPSKNDKLTTLKLKEIGELFDMKLQDHIIVSRDNRSFSFAENKLL